MKKLKKLVLTAFFINAVFLSGYGNIMGSDMAWICLGGDSFLIKVSVYNDCNSATMGNISINFKCATSGTTISTLSLSVPTAVDITPVCATSCSRCDSSTCTFPFGIHRYIYQGIVHLNAAGSCCSVLMSYSYGIRNGSITTGAAGAAFYTEAILNRCQNPCDHSPQFTNSPILILCVGQDYTFNHGIIDTNISSTGSLIDSFTYEWGRPMSAAGTYIAYTGSYNYYNAIYYWGFPNAALPFPRGLHLDPQTGDIQFRPMKPEVTVMVVQVNEFRNGVKIAEIRRDVQVIVITCTNNTPPLITTPNNVRSKSVCAGSPATFTFSTSDANANDTVTINWNHALPGATWTTTNGQSKHPTATLTWTPTDSNVSSLPYTFTVTAKDNACPINAQFTQAYQITVKPNPQANLIVSDSGCGRYWFQAQRVLGSGPTYVWQGQSFNFAPNVGAQTSHQFKPGIYPYSMTMIASGCSHTYFDTIVTDSFIKNTLIPDTIVCVGSTINITSNILYNSGNIKIKWGSGNTVFASDTTTTKTLTVTRDTVIWSVASDTTSCPSADTIRIRIYKPIGLNLGPDIRICSYEMARMQAYSQINNKAVSSFTWTDLKTNTVVGTDSILMAIDSGQYSCRLIDTFGCSNTDTIKLIKNPEVIASAKPGVICYGQDFDLEADYTGSGNVQYLWYNGTKYIGGSRKIKVRPLTTTDYWLKEIENINGVICKDSTLVRVKVNPLPVINISPIDKRCINGSFIKLNDFVTVDGLTTNTGIWSSTSGGLLYQDRFVPDAAGVSTPPGWEVTYEFTDPATGCYNKELAFVTIYALPQPFAGNDVTVCRGTKTILTGVPVMPPGTWRGTGIEGSYLNWKFNPDANGIINGVAIELIYHYTDFHTCENEDTVKYTVNPLPPKPVISLSPTDSFIECSLLDGYYEWFSYSPDTLSTPTTIPNYSRRINPHLYCVNCYYSVIYTDSNGCVSDSSDFYYFAFNSVHKSAGKADFVVYPNPANSLLYIDNPFKVNCSFKLTNMLGNSVIEKQLISGKNAINIENCVPGIYFIYVNNDIVGKVVVE